MAAPSFVNAGTVNASLAGFGNTSGGASLPGSEATPNLLLGFVHQESAGDTIVPHNWVWAMGDQISDANVTAGWAYGICDGVEAGTFFTWSNSTWSIAVNVQYTGNHATTPLGNIASASGSGTSVSLAGIATTQDDSRIVGIIFTSDDQVIPTPSGFTSRTASNQTGGSAAATLIVFDQSVATSGNTSDPIAATIASAEWSAFLIEVKSPTPGAVFDTGAAALLIGL